MTKAEQTRLMAWRLRVLQEAGAGARNVAQTCRRFGLSRRTFYKMAEAAQRPRRRGSLRPTSQATPGRKDARRSVTEVVRPYRFTMSD